MQSFCRFAVRCVVAAMLFLPLATLNAQNAVTQTYRAGLRSIAVPAPTGDLSEIGPDYRVLFEPLAPDTNRLIAAFVLPDDAAAVRGGGVGALKQYALVEVMRRAEFSDVSPDLFKQIEDGMATQFGADLNASLKDQQNELNHKLKALNDNAATVSLDKPVQLGALFSKQDACGFGVIMPVSAKGTTVKMAAGIMVLRVQQRLVFAYLYTEYKDDTSVQWMGKTAEAWADSILAANKP
ncbi:MAG TPA: hypothetical protein VHD85_15170 [Terracidiphilus sp.]|nr:hypothetical protein [Terracidiphilus sp.]